MQVFICACPYKQNTWIWDEHGHTRVKKRNRTADILYLHRENSLNPFLLARIDFTFINFFHTSWTDSKFSLKWRLRICDEDDT